jgi:hypothetical protein
MVNMTITASIRDILNRKGRKVLAATFSQGRKEGRSLEAIDNTFNSVFE